MEGSAADKFNLAEDVVKSMKHSDRQVKNRALAKRSRQRQQEKMEDLRTECERLTLLDNALALQYEEMKENVKAIAFDVGVMETYHASLLRRRRIVVELEKPESKKTKGQNM